MSKNVVIQEGGVGRQFTAAKLKTALVGGGSCNWVPEDEVGLTMLSVSENGTYSASDEGSYGYSQVNVNVPGGAGGLPGGTGSSIIGVDPTTGNESLVTVDENGNIVATEIPSSINVETLPIDVDYADGETIDFTGLVVKAYKKNGEAWTDEQHPNGVIPISELTFPVTVADIGSVSGKKATSPLIPTPFEFDNSCRMLWERTYGGIIQEYLTVYSMSDGNVCVGLTGLKSSKGVCASSSPSAELTEERYPPIESPSSRTSGLNHSYTYNGQTVYYGTWTSTWVYTSWTTKSISPDGSAANDYQDSEIAWTMIYGTITPGGQEIPVLWNRAQDGTTLETSFTITVNATQTEYSGED